MGLRNGILIRIRKKHIRIGNKFDCVEGVKQQIVSAYFPPGILPLRAYLIERNSPPRGEFPINYVPSSRTVSKRTSLEEFVPGASMGVLLLTVLDEGT